MIDNHTNPATVGPPMTVASANAVAGAASIGFINADPLEDESLWGALTDTDRVNAYELDGYVERLETNVMFRRGEVATLMAKLRVKLRGMPDSVEGDTTTEIAVGDLVLIAHTLLRHQA